MSDYFLLRIQIKKKIFFWGGLGSGGLVGGGAGGEGGGGWRGVRGGLE